MFSIDAAGEIPSATWIGAIPYEAGVLGNAVTPLADGGLLATNFMSMEDPTALDKMLAGEDTGNVKEWHPGSGWADVPDGVLLGQRRSTPLPTASGASSTLGRRNGS